MSVRVTTPLLEFATSPGLQLTSSFHMYDVATGRRGATWTLGSTESMSDMFTPTHDRLSRTNIPCSFVSLYRCGGLGGDESPKTRK